MTESFEQDAKELEEFLNLIEEDKENIRRVIETLGNENVVFEVHPKAETTKESKRHSNIAENKIIKTLIFGDGEEYIAALAPGNKRINTEKLEKLAGKSNLQLANPDDIRKETGYIVGGVSPFDLEIPIYMEESITDHDKVRPASGSRLIGVKIEPKKLKELTDAYTYNIAE